jgi:hypothetical protein
MLSKRFESRDSDRAARAADGQVLTEWKKAKNKVTVQEMDRLFAGARAQAKQYTEGSLAGFERTDRGYMIVVSWGDVAVPSDISEDGVL